MHKPQSTDTAEHATTLRPPCREQRPRRPRVVKTMRLPQPIVIEPEAQPTTRRSDHERMLTVATLHDGRGARPMIRMRGGWLARLGFAIGKRIVVSEEQGRIVLTLGDAE